MTNAEIAGHVRKMREMSAPDRRRYLQVLIGAPTDDRMVLHGRALLVSALNEAGVWRSRSRA